MSKRERKRAAILWLKENNENWPPGFIYARSFNALKVCLGYTSAQGAFIRVVNLHFKPDDDEPILGSDRRGKVRHWPRPSDDDEGHTESGSVLSEMVESL